MKIMFGKKKLKIVTKLDAQLKKPTRVNPVQDIGSPMGMGW